MCTGTPWRSVLPGPTNHTVYAGDSAHLPLVTLSRQRPRSRNTANKRAKFSTLPSARCQQCNWQPARCLHAAGMHASAQLLNNSGSIKMIDARGLTMFGLSRACLRASVPGESKHMTLRTLTHTIPVMPVGIRSRNVARGAYVYRHGISSIRLCAYEIDRVHTHAYTAAWGALRGRARAADTAGKYNVI
jgi:hypothetical protein